MNKTQIHNVCIISTHTRSDDNVNEPSIQMSNGTEMIERVFVLLESLKNFPLLFLHF